MDSSTNHSFRSTGFIGLGAMGLPMAKHLASKLLEQNQIYVFDVEDEAMNKLNDEFPEMVVKCRSAKEVAENTVRTSRIAANQRSTLS